LFLGLLVSDDDAPPVVGALADSPKGTTPALPALAVLVGNI
jgi:hypothetical protein